MSTQSMGETHHFLAILSEFFLYLFQRFGAMEAIDQLDAEPDQVCDTKARTRDHASYGTPFFNRITRVTV